MKKLTLTLFALSLCTLAMAQWGDEELSEDEKPKFKDRVFVGGGLGLSFSTYYNFFSVSPLIGYKVTPKLATGIQFQYRYTSYKIYTPKVTTNDYGISPFVRYAIYNPFFLHAEYEYLNYEYPGSGSESIRKGFNSFLAGGGLFQPVGRHAGFYLLALYNFSYRNNDQFSPYSSPLILRAGITAGF
jgi:hypothetical protein